MERIQYDEAELVKLRRSLIGKVRSKDVAHLHEEEIASILQNDIYVSSEKSVIAGFFFNRKETLKAWNEKTNGMETPVNKLVFHDINRTILSALLKLSEEIGDVGDIDVAMIDQSVQIADKTYIQKLLDDFVFATVNVEYHMDNLIERHDRLKIVISLSDLIDRVARRDSISKIADDSFDIMRTFVKAEKKMITPDIEVVSEQAEKMLGNIPDEDIIRMHRFPMLGEKVQFVRKEMHAIGAPPANGKTAFAMQLIEEFVEDLGLNVDAFLLESDWRQYQQRYTARKYGVNLTKFNTRIFTDNDKRAIHKASNELLKTENKLFLAPRMTFTPKSIKKAIRQRVNETGIKSDVIIIDHIGRVGSDLKTTSEFDKQNNTLLKLQEIAEEEDAVLIIMSQLEKDAVKNAFSKTERKLPTMASFKYGSIAEYSKMCMIIFKDAQEMMSNDPVLNQKLVICKSNNGSSGVINSIFVKPLAMHIEAEDINHLRQYEPMLRQFNWRLEE